MPKRRISDTRPGVQRVDRWQTSDGALWSTEETALLEQAALDLRAKLLGDLLPADVDEADALTVAVALREDTEAYIELLTAIVKARNKRDEAEEREARDG
jgi:hypothetical protein